MVPNTGTTLVTRDLELNQVPYYNLVMENVRHLLRQELAKRISKNPSYSLRAFADYLGISHATLSRILSGQRNMSDRAIGEMANKLGLGPRELESLKGIQEPKTLPYFLIQQDVFNSIAEWYYDAILELTLIKKFRTTPENISKALNISLIQAKLALETLERLELIKKLKNGNYKLQAEFSTNELDPDFTNAAKKKYQRSILEKSMEALENISRTNRDHTSTTMAIKSSDLPKVKELIKKFRRELNQYLQRDGIDPDQVYQLQVAFFPLTQLEKE